ncbi:hypothetical protein THAOC_27581, partial [Thalassiosira oceanica]
MQPGSLSEPTARLLGQRRPRQSGSSGNEPDSRAWDADGYGPNRISYIIWPYDTISTSPTSSPPPLGSDSPLLNWGALPTRNKRTARKQHNTKARASASGSHLKSGKAMAM